MAQLELMTRTPAPDGPTFAGVEAVDRLEEMLGRYLGPAILRAIGDPDVTEVYVNPQDCAVRFETRSRGKVDSGGSIDAHRVEMFLNAVASRLGVTLTSSSPRLEAELPARVFAGARLQGFIPPVTSGPAFNIRKPASSVYSLADYVASGVLSEDQGIVLRATVAERKNILVVGGTNTGKTTLANALLHEIALQFPSDRVVILEDTVELQCAARDQLALRTTAAVSLADLLRSSLRTSPSRIIVGEVRGAEALDLLDAWATGHPGGVATLHASSAEGALHRLDRLAQRSNVPPQADLVAEAVHLIVLLEGGHARRRVTEIARVRGLDGDGRFRLQRLHELHDSPGETS
ncbi:MAG: P-type conjugative transfer ATPase TrbB [Gemmatimonadaceae bacterium]